VGSEEAADGAWSWRAPLLRALREAAHHPTHASLADEAILGIWSAVDADALDVETRIVAQNAAYRLAVAQPLNRIGRLALLVVERLALPAARLEALGSEPVALERWLGSREGWIERATDQCGRGPLFHERVFAGAFAFHPIRSEDRRALVAQIVAFDKDGRAHVTPLVEAVELRFGFEDAAPACVLELDVETVGDDGLARLFTAEFEELEARPPFVTKFAGTEPAVACRSCHPTARAFNARDVPATEAPALRAARRHNLVEHSTERLRGLTR
jgi:hypothetical protein